MRSPFTAPGDPDTAKRLKAWDETARDILDSDLRDLFDMVMRTDTVEPREAAERIAATVESPAPARLPEELRAVLEPIT